MKQKISLLALLCLLLNHWLSAQSPAQYNTTRTPQHQQVPGTNVWLIPPKGFKLNPQVPNGFYKDEFNYVKVEEVIGMSYDFPYMRKAIMEDDVEHFQAERAYKINDLRACELQFSDPGPPRVGSHYLLVGNERFTAVVTFYYRSTETSIPAVGECLHSFFVEAEKYPNPLANAGFTLDLAGSGYAFISNDGEGYIFASTGYTELEAMPGIFVIAETERPPGDSAHVAFHQHTLSNLLCERPATDRKPQTSTTIFQGYAAHETLVNVTDKGQPARLYFLSIARPRHYCVAIAVIKRNMDTEMAKVRKIIQTLRFR